MQKLKTVARNLLFAILGQGLEKAISFVVIAVLVRSFTQIQMGQFFLAISIITIVGALTELGTSSHLIRAVASKPDRADVYLSEVLFLRVPVALTAVLATCAIVIALAPSQFRIYALVSMYILGGNLYYAFGAVLTGLQRFSDRVATSLIGPGILLLLVPLGVWRGLEFGEVLLIYAGSSVLMLIVTWRLLVRRINPTLLIPSRQAIKVMLRSALPIFALGILALIHARTDEIMLAAFRGFEDVAVYAAGYKLLEVSRMAIRPVTMVLFPILAATAAAQAWPQFRSHVSKLAASSVTIGILLAACVVPLAGWIVPQVFGESYEKTIAITRVLFLSAPALFLGHAAMLIANSMKLERAAIIVLTCGVAANVLLNALVIPSYGPIGAAWTTLATESAAAVGILLMITLALRDKKS